MSESSKTWFHEACVSPFIKRCVLYSGISILTMYFFRTALSFSRASKMTLMKLGFKLFRVLYISLQKFLLSLTFILQQPRNAKNQS